MFYAVKKGKEIGIFDNWPDAQAATAGFSGPVFKKFKTREEAEAYMDDRDVWAEQVADDNRNGYLVAFTDGSYEDKLNRYSYGVYFIKPDGTDDSICGYGSNKEYLDSKNIIGEIFGVINALDWAISNGFEKIKIYHDYEGLSKWLSDEWKAKAKVSKMFVNLYKVKFADFIQVEYFKVPGHSNIIYNEKADQLAKSALVDRQKVAIQGENWFSIPYFKKDDFDAIAELIEESDANITITFSELADKYVYRFALNNDKVTVTLFKAGQNKLLVQGKNAYLFQVIISTIVELDEKIEVEKVLSSAYRISIKKNKVDKVYEPIEKGFPANYPEGIKRLVKQATINLTHYFECEDYSQYAFPALRALEGHIKYLITESGGTASRRFNEFNLDKTVTPNKYFYTAPLSDTSRKDAIETCYNYYKANRDTVFHFGDIIGSVDNTRFVETKEKADELIQNCINLIKG